ncbi:Type I inositol 1,4,5-trisphosphate 5-phosphatase [Chionoecetes opilio]|uniref:inositol-polyphosphate 5-phosphatase n=1 Tax=Chionoecetes opilio TaxID=41210 RepID=A0A8J4YKY9_CHIOP|nr:Type I inositol 1,4,5-trisphosphate 5-phosphatase [Chionoecetes opilio]
MAGRSNTRLLLVTANIASCFEQPDTMLKPWITEFLKAVEEREPLFIALHCQEVGGKNYEESMQHVEHFIRSLMNRGTMLPFDKIRVYLDEEYESAEKFTALGNLYFIHESVQDIQQWDFQEMKFEECLDRREYSGNIEDVTTKEKSKFPQEFFPECKWSRKGFMRTRWCLNGAKFDLVNIHLFHDASNFVAMEEFPSVYSRNRKRALEHTLDRFHNDNFEKVPIFLFGDFNFRLNTQAVVKKISEGCTMVDGDLPDTNEKAQNFQDAKGQVRLTVSKKAFKHHQHQTVFLKDNGNMFREFDQELSHFGDRLAEFPITFPPSYPFEEGAEGEGSHYMQTRCPSWCDRVILDKAAKKLVDASGSKVNYNLIGLTTTMGDHKPVGLCVEVPIGAGTVQCCSPQAPCRNFVHDPGARCFVQSGWCLCQSYPPCPRPIVASMCSNTSILTPLPGQVPPVTLASACLNSVKVDMSFTQDNVSTPRQCLVPQCVCSAGVSEEKICHQCRCQSQTTEPQVISKSGVQCGDLMRNLLLLGAGSDAGESLESTDQLLKRVNSAPNTSIVPPKPFRHIPLASSHSLDTGRCIHAPNAKLRLRASSSRFLSHHSSSTEEWFEEVLIPQGSKKCVDNSCDILITTASPEPESRKDTEPSPVTLPNYVVTDKESSPISGDHQENMVSWDPVNQGRKESGGDSLGTESMGECIEQREECHSTKELSMDHEQSTEQHSLNNLLLADSCDHLSAKNLSHSESSLSAHYSEDSVSTGGRLLKDGETVSQAPTFDIADVDPSDVSTSKQHAITQKPSNKSGGDVSEHPPGQCCCVLS